MQDCGNDGVSSHQPFRTLLSGRPDNETSCLRLRGSVWDLRTSVSWSSTGLSGGCLLAPNAADTFRQCPARPGSDPRRSKALRKAVQATFDKAALMQLVPSQTPQRDGPPARAATSVGASDHAPGLPQRRSRRYGDCCKISRAVSTTSIVERVNAGLAAARKRGVRLSRPRRVNAHREAVARLRAQGLTGRAIARELGTSNSMFLG